MVKLEVKDCSLEYCASIIKINSLEPVENSQNLVRTIVGDKPILIRKNEIKEGDILIYLPIESKICSEFLCANNLYDWNHRNLNKNYPEVKKLEDEGETTQEDLRSMAGYFGENGRVRIIKLLKQPSCGVIFPPECLKSWLINLSDADIEIIKSQVGTFFNTVNGEKFCETYIPVSQTKNFCSGKRSGKRNKQLEKIDRIIPGQFAFHYDTTPLGSSLFRFYPDTVCDISVKVHGTSVIIGNIKTLVPRFKTNIATIDKLLFKYFPKKLIFKEGYSTIYSSRKVIKNDDLNPGHNNFYSSDIWSEYGKMFEGLLPQGMTIYGEIFGYETGSSGMIQKGYDYGCSVGKNQLMIYRITTKTETETVEWNIEDVIDWTVRFKTEHPELSDRIFVLPLLFSGRLDNITALIGGDDLEIWRKKLIENLQKLFKIEELEPYCKNKVPREGIVLRIVDDPIKEAFKLKSLAFLEREAKNVDKGEIDIEMMENNHLEGEGN